MALLVCACGSVCCLLQDLPPSAWQLSVVIDATHPSPKSYWIGKMSERLRVNVVNVGNACDNTIGRRIRITAAWRGNSGIEMTEINVANFFSISSRDRRLLLPHRPTGGLHVRKHVGNKCVPSPPPHKGYRTGLHSCNDDVNGRN